MSRVEKNKPQTTLGGLSLGQFLKKMAVSSRPISWVNTAFPFVTGYIASGGQIDVYFWLASFYFLIPYNILIYVVNDVFDYESDLRNPRKNSIEGGLLAPALHRPMLICSVVINLPLLLYLAMSTSSLAASLAIALIALGAVSYSAPPLRLKERPVLDSLNSSFHFVSPLIFALILTGWQSSYLLIIFIFFMWGAASHAFGAVQDIIPDREAKISSIATYLGAKKTVRLSAGLYTIVTAGILSIGWPIAILALPTGLYVLMVIPFINLSDKDSKLANRGWRHFLALNQFTGFCIIMLLILSEVY